MTQEEIFTLLKQTYGLSKLVAWLTTNLGITRPTAYHYLSGEREIHYDAMLRLLKTPEASVLSSGYTPLSGNSSIWEYNKNTLDQMTPHKYIRLFNRHLTQLHPEMDKLCFVSSEIPLFYYMSFPILMAFKLFFWSKTMWQLKDYDNLIFDQNLFQDEIMLSQLESNVDTFCQIQTEEYWNLNMLFNTLSQIQYSMLMEWFDTPKTFSMVIKSVGKLVSLLEEIVDSGKKKNFEQTEFGAASFIYQNEIYFTNNTFIVEGTHEWVFTAMDNPNFIRTADPKMFTACRKWITNMKRHCTPLTGNTELNNKRFFDRLRDRMDLFEF